MRFTLSTPLIGEAYVPFALEAIESVRAQTLQDWEHFLVTIEPLASLFRAHFAREKRLHVLAEAHPDKGYVHARNLGLIAGTGELCIALDADDQLEPTYLEKTSARAPPGIDHLIIATDLAEFGLKNGVWRLPADTQKLSQENALHVSCVFSRKLWEAAGGYDVATFGEFTDWDFWLRCFKQTPKPAVAYVRECLFRYRIHEHNTSGYTQGAPQQGLWKAAMQLSHPDLYGGAERERAKETLRGMGEKPREIVRKRLEHFPKDPGLLEIAELLGL